MLIVSVHRFKNSIFFLQLFLCLFNVSRAFTNTLIIRDLAFIALKTINIVPSNWSLKMPIHKSFFHDTSTRVFFYMSIKRVFNNGWRFQHDEIKTWKHDRHFFSNVFFFGKPLFFTKNCYNPSNCALIIKTDFFYTVCPS